MERIVLDVAGMSCSGCVNSVTAALKSLPGVAQVDVSLAAGQASVVCDAALISVAELTQAIDEAGFVAHVSA
jgi:copper chaperone